MAGLWAVGAVLLLVAESGADGNIYLLLEHASGGQIVRIVPADTATGIIVSQLN